jgi:hydroxyacid-oxoacid transhydrogenase
LYFFLGADTTNVKKEDAGLLLADTLRQFMLSLGVDNGLKAIGYSNDDIPALVKGTLPQQRVTKLAPAGAPGEEELAMLFENSMNVY